MRVLGSFFILVALFGLLMVIAVVYKQSIIPVDHSGEIAGWSIFTAIFGVIGLICIVAGGPRKVEIVQSGVPQIQEMKRDDSKTCPACAEEVKREAKICRFCKYSFVTENNSQQNTTKDEYFYQLSNIHHGPVSYDVIFSMLQNNELGPEDQVYIPGQGWHKTSEITI